MNEHVKQVASFLLLPHPDSFLQRLRDRDGKHRIFLGF